MNIEDPLKVQQKQESKRKVLDARVSKIRNNIDYAVDYLGMPIEKDIKESVVALNVLNIPTEASCEGHTNRGISAPWIRISAPDEPDERFIGENDTYQKVAQERGTTLEEVKRDLDEDGYKEAWRRMLDEETEEFREWRKKNKALRKKIKKMMEKFYEECGELDNADVKIRMAGPFAGGEFDIYSGKRDHVLADKNLSGKKKEKLEKRLIKYRAEMKRFSQFLFEQYYKSNS